MIQLDHQLVRNAERILNGANVHRLKRDDIRLSAKQFELHNRQWPKHERSTRYKAKRNSGGTCASFMSPSPTRND